MIEIRHKRAHVIFALCFCFNPSELQRKKSFIQSIIACDNIKLSVTKIQSWAVNKYTHVFLLVLSSLCFHIAIHLSCSPLERALPLSAIICVSQHLCLKCCNEALHQVWWIFILSMSYLHLLSIPANINHFLFSGLY